MKRMLVILLLVTLVAPAGPAGATDYWTLVLDNQPVAAELPPVPVGPDALLVTARSLCQALRATCDVDPSGRIRVTRNATVIEMTENLAEARVNGQTVRMPAAPRHESGALMLPVPFVAELLGCRAEWNRSALTLSLTSNATAAGSTAPSAVAGDASTTQGRKTVPSALPWLASGQLPPNGGFPQNASIPQMPTVSTQAVPLAGVSALPAIGSQPMPTLPPDGGPQLPTIGYTLPASSGVALPATAYEPDMRVSSGERTVSSEIQNPWLDNSVNVAGKMDFLPSDDRDAIGEPYDPEEPRPDPAITGLTVERRYDQFVNAYVIRYRVTNLGSLATDKPMLVRLLVGGRGRLQIVQDVKVDRLTPHQSLSFEWSGDAHAVSGLYDMVVRAQARVMLDDGALDSNKDNNSRSVRLAY
jgi:hypothetical protein